MALRILFAGTPSIAVPSLKALAATGRVAGVLTAPDARSGRGQKETMPEVKTAALELGLPVLQPERLDQSARDAVAALAPDLLVCIAYGKIFGPRFLGLFPRGGINLHPSLLPAFRGPNPLGAAIAAGLRSTGITVQYLAERMDAGDILLQEPVDMDPRETTGTLSGRCAIMGAGMLVKTVEMLESGMERPVPQDDAKATYCTLVGKEDGLVDWTLPARTIDARARSCMPWPRAWTLWQGQKLYLDQVDPMEGGDPAARPGTVLKVDKASGFLVQTGEGLLAVRQLQLQSRKSMDHMSFHNGVQTFRGSVLGE